MPYDAPGPPDTLYLVDPPFSALDRSRIQESALQSHRTLECSGFSRVDIIFTPNHEAVVLDTGIDYISMENWAFFNLNDLIVYRNTWYD